MAEHGTMLILSHHQVDPPTLHLFMQTLYLSARKGSKLLSLGYLLPNQTCTLGKKPDGSERYFMCPSTGDEAMKVHFETMSIVDAITQLSTDENLDEDTILKKVELFGLPSDALIGFATLQEVQNSLSVAERAQLAPFTNIGAIVRAGTTMSFPLPFAGSNMPLKITIKVIGAFDLMIECLPEDEAKIRMETPETAVEEPEQTEENPPPKQTKKAVKKPKAAKAANVEQEEDEEPAGSARPLQASPSPEPWKASQNADDESEYEEYDSEYEEEEKELTRVYLLLAHGSRLTSDFFTGYKDKVFASRRAWPDVVLEAAELDAPEFEKQLEEEASMPSAVVVKQLNNTPNCIYALALRLPVLADECLRRGFDGDITNPGLSVRSCSSKVADILAQNVDVSADQLKTGQTDFIVDSINTLIAGDARPNIEGKDFIVVTSDESPAADCYRNALRIAGANVISQPGDDSVPETKAILVALDAEAAEKYAPVNTLEHALLGDAVLPLLLIPSLSPETLKGLYW